MKKKDLIISVTRDCNLRCRFCYSERAAAIIDVDTIEHLLRKYQPSRVTLTGGEPLLHPHIERIVKIVSASAEKVSLCTNGTLLTPKMTRLLSKLHVKLYISWNDDISHLQQKINLASGYCDVVIHLILLPEYLKNVSSILAPLKPKKVRFLVPYNVDESPYQTGRIHEWNRNLKKTIANTVSLNKHVSFEPGYGPIELTDYKPQCREHVYVDTDGKIYPCCLLADAPFKMSIHNGNGVDFYRNCPIINQAHISDLVTHKPLCPLYNQKSTAIQ